MLLFFMPLGNGLSVAGRREVEAQVSGRITFSECSVLSIPTPVGKFCFPFCSAPLLLLQAGCASARVSGPDHPLPLGSFPQSWLHPVSGISSVAWGRPWRVKPLSYKSKAVQDIQVDITFPKLI